MHTNARLGLAAGEASVLMPNWPFTSKTALPSIYTFSVLLFKSQPSPTFHPQKLSKKHFFSQEYFRYLADNLIP